ncbi:MAG: helix-turn-helix domain-containing protein [Bacillota bacterium]
MLHVRKNFIYELIYTGKLKAIRLSERRFRISEEAWEDFLREEEKQLVEQVNN